MLINVGADVFAGLRRRIFLPSCFQRRERDYFERKSKGKGLAGTRFRVVNGRIGLEELLDGPVYEGGVHQGIVASQTHDCGGVGLTSGLIITVETIILGAAERLHSELPRHVLDAVIHWQWGGSDDPMIHALSGKDTLH